MLRHILDNYSHATAIRAIRAIPDGLNADRVARVARVQVASPVKAVILAIDDTVFNWWLVSYADIENVQVAIWPPSTKAEVLELNPTAINAEPIPSPIDQTMEVISHE